MGLRFKAAIDWMIAYTLGESKDKGTERGVRFDKCVL